MGLGWAGLRILEPMTNTAMELTTGITFDRMVWCLWSSGVVSLDVTETITDDIIMVCAYLYLCVNAWGRVTGNRQGAAANPVPLGEKSLGFSVFYKLVMVLPKTRVFKKTGF